jgi:ribosomal protein L11 methyltransferase
MFKFSAKVLSHEDANSIGEFLGEHGLALWSIEKDCEKNRYALCGYIENKITGEKEFEQIGDEFKNLGELKITQIKETEWVEVYKKSAEPWQCEDLYWIPTFMKEKIQLPEDAIAVYIEPGMAFGSGTHETTQLCARAMVMFRTLYSKTGDLIVKDCIDIGCGSGILGISALKLGLVHATFIDIDEDAIRISQENAHLNGLFPDQMDFIGGDLKINLLGRQADLLMANILADVLVKNAVLLVNSVRSGGLLCLSGILKDECDDIMPIFGRLTREKWGNVLENSIEEGEWVALIYFRV